MTETSTGKTSATSAASSSSVGQKSNTGAIVGGVIGGVIGAAVLAAVLWFLCVKRRKRPDAFDDKMFDPHHSIRHSQADPLDHLTPTTPNMGMFVDESKIDAFPYEEPMNQHDLQMHQMQQAHAMEMDPHAMEMGEHAYDPYAHAPTQQMQMQMPDARNYMGSYNSFADSPYAPAAAFAGVGAAGATAAYNEAEYAPQTDYTSDPYAAAPPGGMSAAAAAKHREGQMERDRALSPESTYDVGSSRTRSAQSHYDDALSHQDHGASPTGGQLSQINEIPPV